MEEAIRKADVLIEALPYIKRFFDKVVVIKYGGSSLSTGGGPAYGWGKNRLRGSVLEDIVFMSYAGMKPVLVHGGGPDITKRLKRRGKKVGFIDGFRVTDKETLQVVDSVLTKLNKEFVKDIKALGGRAFGLAGKEVGLIKVKRHKSKDPKKDLGFVGDVVSIDTTVLERLIDTGIVPVIAPLGIGRNNQIYNVNADSASSAIAVALGAEKFVLLTNIRGILKDKKDPDSLFHTVTIAEVKRLIKKGIIDSGMLPKAKACIDAIRKGVKKAHIIDASLPHALLLEIFTDKGIGTEIVKR